MSTDTQTIKYDAQGDILRIRLTHARIEESEEIQPGLIVDYDAAGNIVGLELLDASDIVHRTPTTAVVEQRTDTPAITR
jgi:uncharacterized protein YuzE